MRVSTLFRNICVKVVSNSHKLQMLEDVAETIFSSEMELPPFVFVIMMHLSIYLVEY